MKRIFEEQRVKNLYEFERLLFPVRMKLELCFKKDELKLARITMDRRYRGYCAGPGTSLVVQRLRLCHLMQGVWVQPLIRELRSYMPHDQKSKT